MDISSLCGKSNLKYMVHSFDLDAIHLAQLNETDDILVAVRKQEDEHLSNSTDLAEMFIPIRKLDDEYEELLALNHRLDKIIQKIGAIKRRKNKLGKRSNCPLF